MPLVPLFGHDALRRRVLDAVRRDALPASLLIEGPRGVGKQRLALWIAQVLLCQGPGDRPCGRCQSCRFATSLTHPDLFWFFPRPRKDSDVEPEQVLDDYRDAVAERMQSNGLYAPPSGMEGIYVGAIRALVRAASISPAIGSRKVMIVGDAERMVSQEGSDQAANAFLKLLEEPPADTTVLLTSSEPGALLPTIRSRVIALRAQPLEDADIAAFLSHELTAAAIDDKALPADQRERVRFAAGAPGRLIDARDRAAARKSAGRILDAASATPADRLKAAWSQGVAGARGGFSDTLDELTVLLHERVRDAVTSRDDARALAASRAMNVVEEAKLMAAGNVNPQLVTASLLRRLSGALS